LLHVHRAERADALAGALAATLQSPLADPFAAEIVAVPTRGMERWLTQSMSTRLGATEGRRDGVCANIEFPFPGRLIGRALATASGVDPDTDPWAPDRLVWPLLQTVDECLPQPWLTELAGHLGSPDPGAELPEKTRRFATVRHIADLYDHYGVRRPRMVQAWARGEEDGDRWQAELWRRLRARVGTASPAERLDLATARLIKEPDLLELPLRIALFGLTRVPTSYMQVLTAIAAAREVHLFVLHPSPALWERIGERTRRAPAIVRRREDDTAAAATNRLLASWGRDSRELQLVLGPDAEYRDHHHPVQAPTATLLERIQADIRHDQSPPGPPLPGQPELRPPLDPGDRSVQIHACHGRARQVEVIRDAILHMLEQDPTLEPRDVIVMCPDIETVAPLIQAAFGAGRVDTDQDPQAEQGKRLPDLRVRLADRSLRQTNPVLGVVSLLLELADERMTASQLLDLADREPVRRRFRFDDDDVARMEEWVVSSGIRWGLDEEHRAPFRLDVVEANTWRAGLDRVLLGVAMTEEDRRMVGGVLPLDDVESGAIDLAGRMAEFVDRVHQVADELAPAQTVAEWATAIGAAADALTATSDRDSWQRAELQRILDDIASGAAQTPEATSPLTLELADVRALLADRLRGRPTRANFRTGHLTVCTLVPMRSVPHRVVCILGLDDGEFPRRAPRDGDDLLLEDPHVGDRDARAEDRQLLLDAVLAASERLIITYTGNDERTNLTRPPAIPVAELLDAVERTVRSDDRPPREQVQIRHPLQPFDPRNFIAGALTPDKPWSFDQVALGGARALAGPRQTRPPFLTRPLPAVSTDLIELDSLVRFVEHPVRAFLRQRLGISVRESLDEVQDALPVELDGLQAWGVGQRLLDGLLAGAELEDCVRAELARGSLPPGKLADPILARVEPIVKQIATEALKHGSGQSVSLDVHLRLPDGRILAGTVPGVYGDTIRRASYSRVRPKDRLGAWVRLLALSSTRPERPFESVVVGRARGDAYRANLTVARIPPLHSEPAQRGELALRQLGALVELYDRGMREVLPIACQSSAAYAHAAASADDGEASAQKAWETSYRFDKEDREPEHLLIYGGQVPFARLIEPPRADEQGDGWSDERSRFGRYARRLWDELLAREVLGDG
jgi:exodeoxyribonuclease V gamma subunit